MFLMFEIYILAIDGINGLEELEHETIPALLTSLRGPVPEYTNERDAFADPRVGAEAILVPIGTDDGMEADETWGSDVDMTDA